MGFCLLRMLLCVALTACSSQPNADNHNDNLHSEHLSLQQQIDALQDKLAQREGELQATRDQFDDPLPPIKGAQRPRLAGIVLGRYSGPVDLDGDAKYDSLRVYLRPVDQHSRPITAHGTARLRLIVTPNQGEPTTILDQTYAPQAFHAANHFAVTGTHDTLKADLPDQRPAQAADAILHVTLTDAATGKVFAAKKEVALVGQTH